MNPTQKIAQLRDRIEETDYYVRRLEIRVRDFEKQLALLFVAAALQILFGTVLYAIFLDL